MVESLLTIYVVSPPPPYGIQTKSTCLVNPLASYVVLSSHLLITLIYDPNHLPSQTKGQFQEAIVTKIHELFVTDFKLAGIVGVSYLVDLESMMDTRMVTRFVYPPSPMP